MLSVVVLIVILYTHTYTGTQEILQNTGGAMRAQSHTDVQNVAEVLYGRGTMPGTSG